MGHLLESLKADMLLEVDFRNGSFKDLSNVHTVTKGGTPFINNHNFSTTSPLNYYEVGGVGSLNVGTDDFTVLCKFKPFSVVDYYGILGDSAGFSGFSPLFLKTSGRIGAFFNSTEFSSSNDLYTLKATNKIAYTADRDGLMTFFKNGSIIISTTNISATAAANLNAKTSIRIARYASLSTLNYLGEIDYIIVIKKLLTATEIQVLTSELEQVPDQRVSSSVTAPDGTPELYFKGELGVLANETATTSGFLENADIKVLSGSFKITTTKTNGVIRKNIECIAGGDLYFNALNPAVAGVHRMIDGVHVTTDLAVAKTISLTIGQVMVYASSRSIESLYQEA